MIKNNKKGFTLIELLVVIAIIGILSGTVIVSMSGTQESAKDSRINSALGQMRTAAEVYKFSTGGGEYTGFNTAMPQVALLIEELRENSSNGATDPVIIVGENSWCAHQVLNSAGAGNSCIDYRGYTARGNYSCKEVSGQNICAADQ
jgi:prepilin-type N-terminal cleavage/methylation domain-containing protein